MCTFCTQHKGPNAFALSILGFPVRHKGARPTALCPNLIFHSLFALDEGAFAPSCVTCCVQLNSSNWPTCLVSRLALVRLCTGQHKGAQQMPLHSNPEFGYKYPLIPNFFNPFLPCFPLLRPSSLLPHFFHTFLGLLQDFPSPPMP